MLTLKVHMIELRSKQILKVRRVLCDLLLILLLCDHVYCPSLIQLWDQVNTFGVVNPVLFPALDQFALKFLGLLRENVGSFLKVATDQFLVNDSLRRVSHF
jgi:fucose permease